MPPIRVLIVDDTVVVRRLVSEVLSGHPDVEVVGTAAHGRLALTQIPRLAPDVVTLDVEMPVMDGLATLAELRRQWPTLPVIMFSTLTSRGAGATLDALALGANDYVTKPTSSRDREAAMAAVQAALLPLIRFWGRPRDTGGAAQPGPATVGGTSTLLPRPAAPAREVPAGQAPAPGGGGVGPAGPSLPPLDQRAPLGVVVGVSTGGPAALNRVVPSLPLDLRVPVVIVQHMPPVFTALLAKRLDESSAISVVEAEDLMPALPGRVHIAAGGVHLRIESIRGVDVLRFDDGPMENSCKPSVDVTLRSAHRLWGARTLTVILTGMGIDGQAGARLLRNAGGAVLVQDAATSVVWGMPGAVAREGLADRILALDDIAPAVVAAAQGAALTTGTGAR